MAPKKGKDLTDDDNYWKFCIEEAPLDDESWKVKVIMIEAAGSDQDRIYLNKFETCAAEERRFVIKNICKTETMFMINQLGGEKKVKDDKLRVFEEGQVYLKEKKDIPPEIMALIIKKIILKMKDEYLFIKKQRLEVLEGIKRESVTMINRGEVRGTVNVKVPESEPPKPTSPTKGKKGEISHEDKNIEIDENKKYSTLLRLRGEEWRDKVYIDDFPIDGPNLYIAVTGFYQPELAGYLIKIGIPLTAIVQVRIDPTAMTVPSSLYCATKREQSQTEMLAEKSLKFWEDLQQSRINKKSADDFKNTAFLIFSPPYWNEEKLSGCHEKIYDELCYLMYDIQDLTRQHSHYLNNMDIITVPKELKENLYQQLYLSKIEELPLESVTIYSILHAILQTVSEQNLSIYENNSTMSYSTINGLEQVDQYMEQNKVYNKSEELVNNLITNLCKIDTSKNKYRVTYGEEYENHKNPIIIDHGSFCEYNTFHLNINLNNIVYSMLLDMPINKIWKNKNKPVGEIKAKINFHINMLLSCFDRNDIETADLNRLIHILAFRKVYNNRSSLKKKHLLPSTITEFKKKYLKRSVIAEHLPKSNLYSCASSISSSVHSPINEIEEFSRSVITNTVDETCSVRFLFDCPDISELASNTEIRSQKPISHMIDDYEYFEDFAGINAFQILLDAFNKFNCVDYKYCKVTDCFILMFYNSHDKNGIAREEWRHHIPTPLCLQDFFDFAIEEHYDWIKNEEDIYDESIKIKTQSECKDTKNHETGKSCVNNTDINLELLMEDSLKYREMKEFEVASPETSNTKILSSKKTNSPVSYTDLHSKSSKKAKPPAFPPPKANFSVEEVETIRKEFSGYDLGDRRVEIYGKDSTFFSEDGTRVSSFYSLLMPMNLEYVTLNIVPGNSHNEFWMHKALGEFIDPKIVDTCESYRVKTKDQLIMYFKKQSFQVPIYSENPIHKNSGETIHKNNIWKSPSPDLLNPSAQFVESKSFYSLFITWPTGLITETVYKNNSSNISHIKQCYVTNFPNRTEDMRCISLDGETIIFNSNGDIEILKPDSSYFKITKCEKRANSEKVLENANSATGSDKSKKGKGKDKDKVKENPTKTDGTERVDNTKATEYELHIEEFEIIESNGLKEKWINDKIFSTEKVLIKTASDFCLGEIFSKRMDGTNILLNKDGILIVTFPNNTRISTNFIIENDDIFPEWTEEETENLSILDVNLETHTIKSKGSESHKSFSSSLNSENFNSEKFNDNNRNRKDGYVSVHLIYVIEHPNFTTITINKSNDKISIESPNDTCVTIDSNNNYEFSLDNATSGRFNGQSLNINYVTCEECNTYNNCDVEIASNKINSITAFQRNWVKMTDSFGKSIIVNEDGNISIIQSSDMSILSNRNENEAPKDRSDSIIAHTKCREMYQANSLKFFVLRRDLTCSELVHRSNIEEYKLSCKNRPWCSINEFDTFRDYRSLWSILTPIYHTESEKWLMESKLSDKPKYLTFKDLEINSGKEFYHWMRPYKRFTPKPMKPDSVLPERLPRAFILRTLEQQWREEKRDELSGAKELINAILRYRYVMEADSQTLLRVPIHDARTENERKTDEIVQAIAHRVYEDMKNRLIEDIQSRAKPTITTKLPPPPEEISEEEEFVEETQEFEVYEKGSAIHEAEVAVEMSPNLKRYWRRREEEYKEEQFYRYLLREDSVPPYFRNVLGGGIWWEVNRAVEDAMTSVEHKKMKCRCNEE